MDLEVSGSFLCFPGFKDLQNRGICHSHSGVFARLIFVRQYLNFCEYLSDHSETTVFGDSMMANFTLI